MRQGILLALVLSLLVLGAGVYVFNAGWLTPAVNTAVAGATTLSSTDASTAVNSASPADAVPATSALDTVDVSQDEGVLATFTSQTHGHLCDKYESADAGY